MSAATAVARKKRKLAVKPGPGYEGRFELGKKTVKNPYDDPRHPEIDVQINKRHDALTWWRSRGKIDEAQESAGRRLQGIWHRAAIGSPGAVRYDNPKVDTSGVRDTQATSMIEANRELSELAIVLGRTAYSLTVKVVCEGAELAEICGSREDSRGAAYIVKQALSDLADFWGTTAPIRWLPITVFHATE